MQTLKQVKVLASGEEKAFGVGEMQAY